MEKVSVWRGGSAFQRHCADSRRKEDVVKVFTQVSAVLPTVKVKCFWKEKKTSSTENSNLYQTYKCLRRFQLKYVL